MKKFDYDVYQSYIGHLKWGNCNSLINFINEKYPFYR